MSYLFVLALVMIFAGVLWVNRSPKPRQRRKILLNKISASPLFRTIDESPSDRKPGDPEIDRFIIKRSGRPSTRKRRPYVLTLDGRKMRRRLLILKRAKRQEVA